MTLIHYAKRHLPSVLSTLAQNADLKPNGLWVSVQGPADWLEWCDGEGFATERRIPTEVTLKADANILHISGPFELDAFTTEYRVLGAYRSCTTINWGRVAAKYQGIIIAPYQWSRRMTDHTFWYYGWDCASGCIWDAEAIESLTPMDAPTECVTA